ncbi:MAG TPA: SDR family NAD(P)-dependent oxidoreductase [Polyangiaceae bacterium]
MLLAQRQFELADQRLFATLSGDANPLHVDAEWAAYVFPGQIVVHGMHALLWALNEHFAAQPNEGLGQLSATFQKPIFLGEKVDLDRSADGRSLTVRIRGETMLLAQLHPAPPVGRGGEQEASGAALAVPRELERDALAKLHGEVHVPATAPLANAFPRLANAVGGEALRGLATLSTVVGMECPGLRSMFSSFAMALASRADGAKSKTLAYRVSSVDRRFGLVTMSVEGAGLEGTVTAFVGRVDTSVPDAEIAQCVKRAEFAGQRPLVVGGSRGLGAVTAVMLAAGGARPIVTYRRSESAAEDMRKRIANIGGECDFVRYDATEGAAMPASFGAVEHAYYFATPRIFRRRLEPYQAADHADFARIYVDGFYELVHGLMEGRKSTPLKVFYPSSAAAGDPPPDLIEYALAKQAGEQLAGWLAKKYADLTVLVERLPRIETGQTSSVVKVAAELPHRAMLPILRRMQEPE